LDRRLLAGVIDCATAMGIISSSVIIRALCARCLFARSQMGPFETIYIDEMVAACNGGGGPLGHPKVYLNLGPAGKIECPYCSRLFVNRAISGDEARPATTPPRVSEERNV
jgi:uncharacterized Zn-finger protein